ncbi:MAG: hypothetical protein AAGI03_05390 [Pseudomonadota bacterium]
MLKFLFTLALLGAVVGELYVLYTGNQVVVWQTKATEGQPVAALNYNPAAYDMLVCRHFDGLDVRVSLYRYAEDDMGGFSHCPIIIRAEEGRQFVEYS